MKLAFQETDRPIYKFVWQKIKGVLLSSNWTTAAVKGTSAHSYMVKQFRN